MSVDIRMVKVRAIVTIGELVVNTPYIQSFSVNVSRGQVSTFSADLKVPYGLIQNNMSGESVVIQAGVESNLKTIFSGIVRKINMQPIFDDPTYVLLRIEGEDILSKLSGKKYTRRCNATTASWVTITNVVRAGLRTGKFRVKKSDLITTVPLDRQSSQDEVTTPPVNTKGTPAIFGSSREKIIGTATILSSDDGVTV